MVAEGHRLGGLQMGEAGHHGIGIGRRLFDQRHLQIGHLAVDLVDVSRTHSLKSSAT